jgi:hypothetical protein
MGGYIWPHIFSIFEQSISRLKLDREITFEVHRYCEDIGHAPVPKFQYIDLLMWYQMFYVIYLNKWLVHWNLKNKVKNVLDEI